MITLDKFVRLVCLQFAFSNTNLFPPWAWRKIDERWSERKERKYNEGTGTMEISPVQNCSLKYFVGELEKAGYKIVDALYQLRPDPKDDGKKRKYCMARFIFVREENLETPSEEFKNAKEENRRFLQKMCEEAFWRVRAFLNPFFQNGEQIPDQYAVSINLEARSPLFSRNGQPIKVWPRDEKGNLIGNEPLPPKPSRCLHVTDNIVRLT